MKTKIPIRFSAWNFGIFSIFDNKKHRNSTKTLDNLILCTKISIHPSLSNTEKSASWYRKKSFFAVSVRHTLDSVQLNIFTWNVLFKNSNRNNFLKTQKKNELKFGPNYDLHTVALWTLTNWNQVYISSARKIGITRSLDSEQ